MLSILYYGVNGYEFKWARYLQAFQNRHQLGVNGYEFKWARYTLYVQEKNGY